MYFEQHIRILEWCLKDYVTGVMMQKKISFEITGIAQSCDVHQHKQQDLFRNATELRKMYLYANERRFNAATTDSSKDSWKHMIWRPTSEQHFRNQTFSYKNCWQCQQKYSEMYIIFERQSLSVMHHSQMAWAARIGRADS